MGAGGKRDDAAHGGGVVGMGPDAKALVVEREDLGEFEELEESPEAMVARIEAEVEGGAHIGVRPAAPPAPARSCGNCGRTGAASLLLCSRCRGEYFCGAKCQRAYWPFHKAECARNDFADAVSGAEPEFARFLRKHGKQAVIRDENVLDMTRPGGGPIPKIRWGDASGVATLEDRRRQEGKLPLLGDVEQEKMLIAASSGGGHPARLLGGAKAAKERAWAACLPLDGKGCCPNPGCPGPRALGDTVKWRQAGGWVEVYVRVPESCTGGARDVRVDILPKNLRVKVHGETLLSGELGAPVRADESTWTLEREAGILQIHLVKQPHLTSCGGGPPERDQWHWDHLILPPNAAAALTR